MTDNRKISASAEKPAWELPMLACVSISQQTQDVPGPNMDMFGGPDVMS